MYSEYIYIYYFVLRIYIYIILYSEYIYIYNFVLRIYIYIILTLKYIYIYIYICYFVLRIYIYIYIILYSEYIYIYIIFPVRSTISLARAKGSWILKYILYIVLYQPLQSYKNERNPSMISSYHKVILVQIYIV